MVPRAFREGRTCCGGTPATAPSRTPGRRCSTSTCARARRDGAASPSTPSDDYDEYVDGKPRHDGVRSFLVARHRRRTTSAVDAARRPQERARPASSSSEDGVEAYEARSLRRAARDAGPEAAVVSSSANSQGRARRRPASATCSTRASTASSSREQRLRGKPAPDTFLEARARLGVEPAQAAVFEDALAGVEAGRAGGFGCVVGVDRVGQREALREHGADSSSRPRRAARDRADRPPTRSTRGAIRETAARPRPARPVRVGLRAVQRPPRHARQPRRGRARTGCPAPTSTAFYERRPLPYAEARYGNPEAARPSSTSPTAS